MIRPVALGIVLAACTSVTTTVTSDAGRTDTAPPPPTTVDLLIIVDNSIGGMWASQLRGAASVASFAEALFVPSDASAGERAPQSLHVGVVSTDLGAVVPNAWALCTERYGDDAALNPARFGAAQRHLGPDGFHGPFRPSACRSVDEDPAWFALDGDPEAIASFGVRIGCVMNLGNWGCEFKQPLEVVRRRFQLEAATRTTSDASAADRFLRDDSLVVILIFSRDDDSSFRDCSREPPNTVCDDASDVSDPRSTRWSRGTAVDRLLRATPCGANDPTWPLERYHDPRDPSRGLLSIRPGHPERVLFAVVGGVPLPVPNREERPEWDQLLGTSDATADDFCGRRAETAITGTDAYGPFTMRPAVSVDCAARVMPACRRRPDIVNTSCEPEGTFVAHPARRLVEIARRFDESPLCGGRPCRNGFVTSVCETDYRPAMRRLAARVRQRIAGASP